jgi:hypothetical protein
LHSLYFQAQICSKLLFDFIIFQQFFRTNVFSKNYGQFHGFNSDISFFNVRICNLRIDCNFSVQYLFLHSSQYFCGLVQQCFFNHKYWFKSFHRVLSSFLLECCNRFTSCNQRTRRFFRQSVIISFKHCMHSLFDQSQYIHYNLFKSSQKHVWNSHIDELQDGRADCRIIDRHPRLDVCRRRQRGSCVWSYRGSSERCVFCDVIERSCGWENGISGHAHVYCCDCAVERGLDYA